MQAVSSALHSSSAAPGLRGREGVKGLNAELRIGSSLGWGHPQREGGWEPCTGLLRQQTQAAGRSTLAGSIRAPGAGCTKPVWNENGLVTSFACSRPRAQLIVQGRWPCTQRRLDPAMNLMPLGRSVFPAHRLESAVARTEAHARRDRLAPG